jgi:hypothetical protein
VNKRADEYIKSDANAIKDPENACKWNLLQLKNWFQKNGIEFKSI